MIIHSMIGVRLSCGCCNEVPLAQCCKTTRICSLTVPKVGPTVSITGPRARHWQSWFLQEAPGDRLSPFSEPGPLAFLGSWPLPPIMQLLPSRLLLCVRPPALLRGTLLLGQACPNKPGSLPQCKMLTLITPAESFLPPQSHPQVPGTGM